MDRNLLRKPSIRVLIVLLLISSLAVLLVCFLWIDQSLQETRGYGLIGLPAPPGERADKTLHLILECQKSLYGSSYNWPEAKIISENVPELVLVDEQPHNELGTYILKSSRTKQIFLYSPKNNLVEDSKLNNIIERLWSDSHAQALPIVACVMAARRDEKGMYYAYEDYPSRLKMSINIEAWQKWYFIMNEGLVYYIQSDIPPVPGCLAHIFLQNRKLSRFYYPEEIIPLFKAIYPDADIPEDQMLRE